MKQAMALASTRSSLLLETENRLTIAQGRIKSLERAADEMRDRQLCDERAAATKSSTTSPRKDDNILSITIASLQNLLLEKDTTLSRYQDLLRVERQTRASAFDDHRAEVKQLQTVIEQLELKCKLANREMAATKEKLHESEKLMDNNSGSPPVRLASSSRMKKITFEEDDTSPAASCTSSTDHHHQVSDKFIEDMFLDDRFQIDHVVGAGASSTAARLASAESEIVKLQAKLRDVSNREVGWERSLTDKDKEIATLTERVNRNDQLMSTAADMSAKRHELDQLREMLEEKDRHITDLTDTLNHFHDDQQKFINDTSLHSAEQVSQLSADLNRCEATNRIVNTQLDALKRQLANIGQRELQAREMIKTLKTQLIRRPVISVKSADRTAGAREEQLQKRVHQLESELQQTKDELRKQTNAMHGRRTKDAAELGLWHKQKRFQQLAESLKERLSEREAELERVRQHLTTAKTTIARLEREKHLLEARANRAGAATGRYCQSASCPSLHVGATNFNKYTPAESPESYDVRVGEASVSVSSHSKAHHLDISDGNQEILDALKGRIEQQQRRIVAMELEGRGSSAIAHELEKLQEKCSTLEALNIRLEAKNLHLQLDNDMLRQSDHGEKTKRQIKHLEEYGEYFLQLINKILLMMDST